MSEGVSCNGDRVPRKDLTTQACDMCRKRKVKCQLPFLVSSQAPSPCQRCKRLNLVCTFASPSRTRGPKRRDRELTRHRVSVSAEPQALRPPKLTCVTDVCSRELFRLLMQDYLDRLYPLVPIIHRPSFRASLLRDQDREDETFCAMTLAIAALVVATLASRFSVYESFAHPLKFSSRKDFVHSCYQKVVALRDSSYFDQLNFQKFSVSYLFFAAFLQLGDHNWSRMFSVEAMQLARLLKLHNISDYEGLNCIETQLRKKGFWLVFYCYVHASLQNLQGDRLTYLDPVLMQSIDPEDLMPIEIDDEFIFEHEVMFPRNSTPCLTSGYNVHSRIFWASIQSPSPGKSEHEPCPCARAKDHSSQVIYFKNRLVDLQHLLDNIPPVFQSWEYFDGISASNPLGSADTILRSQFSSMRVNIHVTHLWLQSLIIDQLEAAQTHQQISFDPRAFWVDREALSRQLLLIIFNSPSESLEANGLHLATKVRDIAASLLSCPLHPEDPIMKQVTEYVRQSTEILSKLDSSEGMNTLHLQTWVDTDRLPDSER